MWFDEVEQPTLIVIEGSYGTVDENLYKRFSSLLRDACGCSLIYLPLLLPSLPDEARKYFLPSLGAGNIRPFVERFYASVADSFEVELSEGKRYCIYTDSDSDWDIIDITGWDESRCEDFLERSSGKNEPKCLSLDDEDYRFCCSGEKPLPARYDEKVLDPETLELMDQASRIFDRMKEKGLGIDYIKYWLDSLNPLSRLRITAQGRILLTGYDLEVKMSPLPKTVYLFYLRHGDKVMNLSLKNYREELYRIYGRLAKSDNPEKMMASIDLLVDPNNNSMFEKCSYIKAAFECVVDPSIAKHYYISSYGMISRRIPLDRDLVDWELEI